MQFKQNKHNVDQFRKSSKLMHKSNLAKSGLKKTSAATIWNAAGNFCETKKPIIKQVLRGCPPHLQIEKSFNTKGPTFFGIHMRPYCNFHCQKCFMGEMQKLTGIQSTLTIQEIFKIMDKAKEAGALVFGLTGAGEPLMDNRIMQIIEKSYQLGFITILVTNVSTLNYDRIHFLKEHDVTILLSFDNADVEAFTAATRTTRKMFNKVLFNIKTAQDIFSDTKTCRLIDNQPVEIYRIAIHTTLRTFNLELIKKIKKLVLPSTLFSLSPLADIGNAKEIKYKKTAYLSKLLSEKHVVVMKDKETGRDVCGFFRLGIDINFDGQFLIDAHAIESRGLLGNIRDLNYDIQEAFKCQESLKIKLTRELLTENFCPVRTPGLYTWLKKNVTR